MIPIDDLVKRLQKTRKGKGGWTARCPAHDDKNPSLSVSLGDDGRILLHCHAGCDTDAVLKELGLSMRDLMPECKSGSRPARKTSKSSYASEADAERAVLHSVGAGSTIAGRWEYFDKHGAFVFRVLRIEIPGDKSYRPIHQLADGRWAIGDPQGPLPLYRLNELQAEGVVLVAEGEKCVDELVRLGYCATTSSHGANSARKTDWLPLAGRDVVILPDNDKPGRGYAEDVAKLLSGLTPPASVRFLTLPNLGEGQDIVDFVLLRRGVAKSDADIRDEIDALITSAPRAEAIPEAASTSLEFQPFPLDRLPRRLRRIILSVCKGIGCDPAAVALPMLSVVGAAIGNTARIQIKEGWLEPAMLWTLTVAPSGQHKTPVFRFVVAPVHELERRARKAHAEAMERFDAEMMAYERELKEWKNSGYGTEPPPAPAEPVLERYLCQNTTLEALLPLLEKQPRSILVTAEEFGMWLGSFNQYRNGRGSDETYWLGMYGATSITVDRRGDRGSTYVESPFVCVTGGVQPKTLRRLLSPQFFESGLVARLLFVMPPTRRRRFTPEGIPEDARRDYASIIFNLYGAKLVISGDGNLLPTVYRLSPEALKRFSARCDALGDEQMFLQEDLWAAWSKIEGAVARIALILHVLEATCEGRQPSSLVSEVTMQDAIAISEWCGVEVKRTYAILGEGQEACELRRATERIREFGGSISVRDWQRCRSSSSAQEARDELDRLVKAGLARWERDETRPTGGHQTERLVLLDRGPSDTWPSHGAQRGQVSVSEVSEPLGEAPADDSLNVGDEEVLEGEEQDPASSPHGNYGSDSGSIHDAVAAVFLEPSDTSDTDTWPPASPPEGQVSDEGGREPSSDDDEWEDA